MWAKAKADPDFRQRVINFIDSCIQEYILEALDTTMGGMILFGKPPNQIRTGNPPTVNSP